MDRLRVALVNDGYGELSFLKDITSNTPFWAERGYPEYAKPIRVTR